MTNYRFMIGSDSLLGGSNNCAMFCFTIKTDKGEMEAIQQAQVVVDSLQLASEENDFGNRIFTSDTGEQVVAHEVNVYTGERLVVTADHIEDEWNEKDN